MILFPLLPSGVFGGDAVNCTDAINNISSAFSCDSFIIIVIPSDQAEETLEERAQFVQYRLLFNTMAVAFVES